MTEVPGLRFCYNERLTVDGNCRMCLVKIEKASKPIASCAFPVASSKRIYANTLFVKEACKNVFEGNPFFKCAICKVSAIVKNKL